MQDWHVVHLLFMIMIMNTNTYTRNKMDISFHLYVDTSENQCTS